MFTVIPGPHVPEESLEPASSRSWIVYSVRREEDTQRMRACIQMCMCMCVRARIRRAVISADGRGQSSAPVMESVTGRGWGWTARPRPGTVDGVL